MVGLEGVRCVWFSDLRKAVRLAGVVGGKGVSCFRFEGLVQFNVVGLFK